MVFNLGWLQGLEVLTLPWFQTQREVSKVFQKVAPLSSRFRSGRMSEEEECGQLQAEETEVLTSIYEGDPSFSSEPEKKLYSYKFGQVG